MRHAIPTPRRITRLRPVAILCLLLTTVPAVPYSVQTHEELIDIAWKQSIQPILLKQYPTLTEAQLQEAHAYAYGGSAIQDFGYYPFGNAFFSDLTHYVRSGDFVINLLRDAHTADELAFAIGSLSHYLGDTIGHSTAVNFSVPVEFPKLEKQYGTSVNYAENPHAHVQTEFAFDINQLSKRRFAPSAYLKHVGLEVPRPLLRKAFFETYGLNLPDIIGTKETSLRIYRKGVRSFIPNIARAETLLHKKNFPQDMPSPDLDALRVDTPPGLRRQQLGSLSQAARLYQSSLCRLHLHPAEGRHPQNARHQGSHPADRGSLHQERQPLHQSPALRPCTLRSHRILPPQSRSRYRSSSLNLAAILSLT